MLGINLIIDDTNRYILYDEVLHSNDSYVSVPKYTNNSRAIIREDLKDLDLSRRTAIFQVIAFKGREKEMRNTRSYSLRLLSDPWPDIADMAIEH